MPPPFRRSLPIAGVAVLMTAALALAVPPAGAAPHVRPDTLVAQDLLQELTGRSAAAGRLADEIEPGEFVVYIRHRVFTDATLKGRIGLLRSGESTRYLIVELAADFTAIERSSGDGVRRTFGSQAAREFRTGYGVSYSEAG